MASVNPSPVSDQKRRALAALERRFAATTAKTELPQGECTESKKRSRGFPRNPQSKPLQADVASSLVSPQDPQPPPSITDGEAHPIYSDISEFINANLIHHAISDSNRRDGVRKLVMDIVQKGEEGGKFASGARSLKLDNWVLLDNFVPKNEGLVDARMRALSSHSKRSRKHMSMKQHRRCGSFNLPKEFHNFDLFKPMHEMWREYIIELTKETGKKRLAERLLTADLHGAFILVVECGTISFKGVCGIMIRETAETYGLISQDNHFRVVPKAGSVFMFQAGSWKITLCGDKLSQKEKLKENWAAQHLQHHSTK